MNNILQPAIINNAYLCELICDAKSHKGTMTNNLWFNNNEVPMFYPNLVTLSKNINPTDYETIHQLISIHPKNNWAIKDSFASLDFNDLGFFELFESYWFHFPYQPLIQSNNIVEIIKSKEDLLRFEKAWAQHQPLQPENPIFENSLLKNEHIVFLAIQENNIITKGLIANISDNNLLNPSINNKVIGISNIFGFELFDEQIICTFIQKVYNLFGNLDLVGYESLEDIERAKGFSSIAPLKVWMKS